MDSFVSLLYAQDPKIKVTDMGPRGKLKDWVVGDKMTPTASYLTKDVGFLAPTVLHDLILRRILTGKKPSC